MDKKGQKKKEREAKCLEKLQKKMEKEQQKAVKKSAKPGECLKLMVVYLDGYLIESTYGCEIISKLCGAGIQYKVCQLSVPFSILFYRQDLLTHEEKRENEAIVVIYYEEFVELVRAQILDFPEGGKKPTMQDKCKSWKSALGLNITYVVYGLDQYYKKQKTIIQRNFREDILHEGARKRKKMDQNSYLLSRVDIETALVAAHIHENVNHRLLSDSSALADFVCQFAKSVSEKPYKQEKQSSSVDFKWYAEGSCINCVKIDKSGIGLLKLWHQQLRQFNNVGIEVAQAIAARYPSPNSLWLAYDGLAEEKGSLLLADIPVRRGQGVLTSTRCVGPELSKKIYKFMTSKNSAESIASTK